MSKCAEQIFFSTETNLYEQYEGKSASRYNRTCIDGKVTGCGKCVGYCTYSGHPGFLTAKHREEHDCIAKECFYYIAKPQKVRARDHFADFQKHLLSVAQKMVEDMEGLKIINATPDGRNGWKVNYVTISNDYPLNVLRKKLETQLDSEVTFCKLNYSFDTCVQLILAG